MASWESFPFLMKSSLSLSLEGTVEIFWLKAPEADLNDP